MIFTNPSKADYNQWILKENGIECNGEDQDEKCIKDNKEIRIKNNSSHFRNTGLFSSYEKYVEFENGEKITIRLFGVFGNLFPMDDGILWEILN
ncbi:hypothetical protein D8M04_03350 [Oceanobacillus piezotolerans]|uniref:Uncharacterized protein n=2 Tax=Oceanobacillus piezotolerans TaxID=2448030 RepID=A0A498DB14_9BACI|nr:hypothetical protein D8M04_03350 [Oceanobacillus piezotolerans]